MSTAQRNAYVINCRAYLKFTMLAEKFFNTNKSRLGFRCFLLALGHKDAIKRFLSESDYYTGYVYV